MTDEKKREQITVVATQKGYYDRVRTPEDRPFVIFADEFSKKWMKRVDEDTETPPETEGVAGNDDGETDGADGSDKTPGGDQGEDGNEAKGENEPGSDKSDTSSTAEPKTARTAKPKTAKTSRAKKPAK